MTTVPLYGAFQLPSSPSRNALLAVCSIFAEVSMSTEDLLLWEESLAINFVLFIFTSSYGIGKEDFFPECHAASFGSMSFCVGGQLTQWAYLFFSGLILTSYKCQGSFLFSKTFDAF